MNKKIQTTELGFDEIKQNLKTFLSGQAEFSDYNFEGSGMSILLDVLAYNTHYNSLYLNLALNEAFLDTASKRASVVSKAKELGYVPRSAVCATARVNIIILDDNIGAPDYIEIPAYSIFNSSVDGINYTFYTTQSYIAYKVSNQYVFNDVLLKEGKLYQYSYEYTEGRKFVIPNSNVDITTAEVSVQESINNALTEVFVNSNDIIDVDGSSKVYFIKENYDGFYELEFGNGDLGKQLAEGNYITIRYLISSLDLPNGISQFSYNAFNSFVTTVDAAYGGSGPEDIESIRWNAPRFYTTQNRCITPSDYKNIIKSLYSAKDVNVWGGETASPPQYGKVFISIVPNNAYQLTDDEKDYILKNILEPRKSLSITPEFIDPTYINIEMDVKVYYDPSLTTRSSGEVASIVLDTIEVYNERYLSTFSGIFRQSRLSSDIDSSENSITSNFANIKLHRELSPIYGVDASYTIELGNAIKNSPTFKEAVLSSGFYIAGNSNICFIEDNPPALGNIGIMRMFYRDGTNAKIYLQDVGTIDYSKGIIQINNITIVALFTNIFELVIIPEVNDIVSSKNQFVQIDSSKVTITPIIDTRKGL